MKFKCNTCHEELEADVSLAGEQVECPSCSASLVVPRKSTVGISCPHCFSDACKKVSMVFESQTSVNSTVAMGGTLDLEHVGGAFVQTTSQSHLAARLAPPSNPSLLTNTIIAELVIAVGGIFVYVQYPEAITIFVFVAFLVLLSPVAIIEFVKASKAKEDFPLLLSIWNASWVCSKCGKVFMPKK